MIVYPLVAAPVLAGLLASPARVRPVAPTLLIVVASMIATAAVALAIHPPLGAPFVLDATSRLFVALIDVLFLGIAAHVASRAAREPELAVFSARFTVLALPFLGFANLAVLTDNLLLSWCALELTTFLAAPLVADDRAASGMQASWQYFLFSSIGLAIVLAGMTCLDRAEADLQGSWARLGLALLVAGYGTKLGLVPMNTWLPVTYATAPAPVTALLGAVQFNCTLVGLLRVVQLASGQPESLVPTELLWLGMASMAVSTFGIVTTRDYVRLLGYASINHAGVIAVGLGLGKGASYAVILYVVSNAFIKAILFLTAGRVRDRFRSTDAGAVHGLIKVMPFSGVFLMIGTFALLGLPPFGSFLGELLILSAIVATGRVALVFPFCALLAVSFVATGRTLFPMIWGEAPTPIPAAPVGDRASDALPKALFLVALVALGLYIPTPVNALLREVAGALGSR
jgi:hydrogenase-4 component F